MTRISENGASMSAIYRHIGVLRLFYDFLNLGGVVSYVAPRLVKLRCPPRQPTRLLSELEVRRLIAAAQTPRERALVEFLYGSGCRLSEATHLKVEDLDLVGRTARVTGKFRKVRIVLLTATATEALRAYVGNRESGYVFQPERHIQKGCLAKVDESWVAIWTDYGGPGPKFPRKRMALGRVALVSYESALKQFNGLMDGVNLVHPPSKHPLCSVTVEQVLRRVGERVGLKKVGPHMLRRSFATHLYDHGASLEVIQALLGHRYMQTTALYTRLGTGRILNTFQKCHPREKMNENASQ